MQPIPIFHARVMSYGSATGGLAFLDTEAERRAAYLSTLAGKRVDVIIRPHREQRTTNQNSYYWSAVVELLAEHCGYEKDEMHELLALRFLRIEADPITGSPRRQRTPKTNTAEFAAYLDQCIRFAAELGVAVPDPEQVEV